MAITPRFDLRPGITEPVVLMISRRQVESADITSVLSKLKPFLASPEEAWRYRGQMTLVVDGYNEEQRELIDIPEVRAFLQLWNQHWPYWAFFLNQVDDSIKLLGCCVCGTNFPGAGTIEIDGTKLVEFLRQGFGGMNVSAPATTVDQCAVSPTKSVTRRFQGSSASTASALLAAGKSRSTRRSQV